MPQDEGDELGRQRRWPWLLLILWLAACLWLTATHRDAIAAMALPDTDDNLRLLQVRDWLAGQSWSDLRQYRLDPPAGADIHWSRLVDLPLAAVILLLAPLGNANAETVAVVLVPLLTLLAAMTLAAAIARRAIAPDAWPWAPAILLMASPALGMMSPLRIDHHGWQIVALLAMTCGLVAPDRRRGGLIAGGAVAASLAIGVEMLPYLALGVALAAAGWIADPREGERLGWMGGAAAAGTLAALLLFIAPAARWGAACDALSSTHALPILIGGAGVLVATRMPRSSTTRRSGLLIGVALLAALPLLGAGGICLTDLYRAVDPDARRLWLDVVSEALPLHRQTREVMLATLVLPLIGLAGAIAMLVHGRAAGRRQWATIVLLSVASILLSFAQTRAGVAAQVMAVPGAAALGWLGRERLKRSGSILVRIFGSVALFMIVAGLLPRLAVALVAATLVPPGEAAREEAYQACLAPRAIAPLGALPPGTFLGFIDATPALVVHSPLAGIAGPYHRNGRAIADVMHAWTGNEAEAHAIVRRHRAAYVLLCGESAEASLYRRRAPDGFYARLARGAAPDWLDPVRLPTTPWRVWRVIG